MNLNLIPFSKINRLTHQRNIVIVVLVGVILIGVTTVHLYQKKIDELKNKK